MALESLIEERPRDASGFVRQQLSFDAMNSGRLLQGLDHDDVQEAYGPMVAIPTSVVISRDGLVCARYTGLPPTTTSEGSLEQRVKAEFEREIKLLLDKESIRQL